MRIASIPSRSSGLTSWNNLPCYIWESPWKLQSANTRHFFWEFGLEWIFPAASLLCSNSYISFLLLPKNMSLDKFGDLFYSRDELFVVLSCSLCLVVVKAPWHWWRNPILLLLLLLPLKRFGGSFFWFFLQCQKSSSLACQRPPIHHQGMSNYSVLVPFYWIEYICCASLFLSSMALEVMMIVVYSDWIKKIPLNRGIVLLVS